MGPFLAFVAIWAVVIGLHAAGLLNFYEPFSIAAASFIFASVALAWLVARKVVPNFSMLSKDEAKSTFWRADRFRDLVFVAAGLILIFEVIAFGGVPLYWMVSGLPKGYADFGYPTLHGIFNGMLMFVTSASGAMMVMGFRRRKNGALFVLGVAIMGLLYSRAMLVITLIQVAGVVLFRLRTHFTVFRAVGIIALTLIGLFGFGVLGNLRSHHEASKSVAVEITPSPVAPEPAETVTQNQPEEVAHPSSNTERVRLWNAFEVGYNPFIGLISEDRAWIFSYIPTEFLWSYAYITSGFNNLLFNLHTEPTMTPATTFAKLVPTIVYSVLGADKQVDNFTRAHPSFTVSTAFAGPVSDFGYFGFLLVIPLLVGTAAAYRGARAGGARPLLLYAMLFQSVLLTPYVDTVLYTTFVLQMALAALSTVDMTAPLMQKSSATRPLK